jgi:hypothetical protein
VQVGSNTEPDLIVINNGPKGDKGDKGDTGATGSAGPNSVTSATTSDGTADLDVASLRVYPSGSITLVSTNSGGFAQLSGQAATDARSIAFPNASGNLALVASTTGAIASADISDFTAAVEAIAPDAVTSETTSDGTASLDISDLTLSQDVTSGLQTAMTLSGNPTTVGDGQQIIWQWYNGGSPVTTAVIATEVTSSNSDKFLFKTSESGSLATSLDLNNSLATFSGVVSSLGSTYQTGSTFTYNGASAAAHRTALGVSASADTVLKSAYTPSHSLLVQQSGTGSPSSLSVGNNTILGRASGGGSAIAALSGSDARTVLGLSTLATTTPAENVATFLETPTSANLAAAVTGETGSGALVFAASPTLSNLTVSGTGIVATLGTDPAVLAVGTPATTGAFVGGYYAAGSNNSTIYFGQNSYFAGGQWTQPNTSAQSATFLIQAGTFLFYSQSSGNASNSIGSLFGRFSSAGLVVGSSAINAKAKLQVDSTTQGFLPPRMTTTERNAITSVPAGLMIYNTSLNKLNVYNGTTWETVTSL